jgi:poly-gamma-glutamate capsule biosynthesis protein CapA/YwtB (metallophosphatase superfamily)
MRSPMRPVTVAAMAAFLLMLPVVTAASLRAAVASSVRPASPPAISSKLPAWLAPGGRLVVTGWAGARQTVVLLRNGRPWTRTTSGLFGRFRFRVVAPGPGSYRLSVRTSGGLVAAGTLEVRPLLLAAVGDVTFGSDVERAVEGYGPRYPWLSVARLLRSADIATANLEGAVSTRGSPAVKEYTFRGPPSALAAAARFAGLDVVSLANNHSLDFGVDAFGDTLRTARRLGLRTVGGGGDLGTARRPAYLEAGGLRIAFLGYSDVRPLGFTAAAGVPGTAPAFRELIEPDVARARRSADVVVVWFHWGEERQTWPNGQQQALAAAALNAGATVVLGAHPHVLQPISRPSRRRLVAWSLGNFVFPAHSSGTEQTGVLLIQLDARGVRRHFLRPARISGVQPRLS